MLSRNICRSLDAKIVTKDLIGYWHWQVGAENGIWKNQSPNTFGQYDGVIYNTTKQTEGFNFDGSSGRYIDLVNFPFLNNNYTIEAILYDDNYSANEFFFSQWASDTNKVSMGFASKYPFYTTYPNSSSSSVLHDTNTIMAYRNNTMLNYVQTPSGRKIYYNGKLDTWDSRVDCPTKATKTVIGTTFGTDTTVFQNSYHGWVKVIRIYNRALTDAEIAQNYAVKNSIGL